MKKSDYYVKLLKKLILDFLKDDNVKIIFFGSRARGDDTAFSDVDIGIIPCKGFENKKLTLLREHIENSTIPYKIDIVDFSVVSDDFEDEVIKDAEIWKG